jgi:hypothetical protein
MYRGLDLSPELGGIGMAMYGNRVQHGRVDQLLIRIEADRDRAFRFAREIGSRP